MTIDVALNIIEIFVTIAVGFYLTHLYNIRDSRTRTIKDGYISSLNHYKEEIQDFYKDIVLGKANCKSVIQWHKSHIINYVAWDNSVSSMFDVIIGQLNTIYGDFYSVLTSLEEFNNQWENSSLVLSNDAICQMNKQYEELLIQINTIVSSVNEANRFNFIMRWLKRWKSDCNYVGNRYKNQSCSKLRVVIYIISHYLWVHVRGVVFLLIFFIVLLFTILHFKQYIYVKTQEDFDLNQLTEKLDSINESIKILPTKNDTLVVNIQESTMVKQRMLKIVPK